MCSRIVFGITISVFSFMLTGCFSEKPKETLYELVGSKEERIEELTKILSQENDPLPSPITRAYLLEVKLGDGRMGPSDFQTYSSFDVEPDAIEKWTSLLGDPIDPPFPIVGPGQKRFWWLTTEEAKSLTFYLGRPLSGRVNGWAAVDREKGRIYLYSFTI